MGNSIFLVAFVCAELPSQLISKKIGPDRWIPTLITLWSLVGMSQASLSGKNGFFITRAFMGVLEVSTKSQFSESFLSFDLFALRGGLYPILSCGFHTSTPAKSFQFV
jgi:hypothetical protein